MHGHELQALPPNQTPTPIYSYQPFAGPMKQFTEWFNEQFNEYVVEITVECMIERTVKCLVERLSCMNG